MDRTNTPAYNGETNVSDDAAFGCLALLWATEDRKYLEELCYDETIGKLANPEAQYPKLFNGGWFTYYDPVFYHASANTDWASDQAHVLWGFFRLILNDDTVCENLNISKDERLKLIEKTVYNLIANLSSVGLGDQMIQLRRMVSGFPQLLSMNFHGSLCILRWSGSGTATRLEILREMFYYYDIASKIQNLELPTTPASTDWKAEEVKTILIRMMDYMLGVNPWDISMIYGVGDKNFNHPHHRAANQKGKTYQVLFINIFRRLVRCRVATNLHLPDRICIVNISMIIFTRRPVSWYHKHPDGGGWVGKAGYHRSTRWIRCG